MRKGTWWEKARRAMERTKGTPAYEYYWAADDAFEKANVFRRVSATGAGAKADMYHRKGVKAFKAGEAAEAHE